MYFILYILHTHYYMHCAIQVYRLISCVYMYYMIDIIIVLQYYCKLSDKLIGTVSIDVICEVAGWSYTDTIQYTILLPLYYDASCFTNLKNYYIDRTTTVYIYYTTTVVILLIKNNHIIQSSYYFDYVMLFQYRVYTAAAPMLSFCFLFFFTLLYLINPALYIYCLLSLLPHIHKLLLLPP